MARISGLFKGPDGEYSFSRMWGVGFGMIVIVAYIHSYVTKHPLPPETMYLLMIAMAPYVSKQGGEIMMKVFDAYRKDKG